MKTLFIKTLLLVVLLQGCGDKLNLKPDSRIVLPKSYKDMERILDNTDYLNFSPDLPQISADEYFIPSKVHWESLRSVTARNASIWAVDTYRGDLTINDWSFPYKAIYFANNVLQLLENNNHVTETERRELRGWALFMRAYNFYSLVSTFSKAYDPANSVDDLGIPLKLSSDIDEIAPRSSVAKSYEQIIADALESSELLPNHIVEGKKNRPSRVAAYALLARVYLSMRNYEKAGFYSDKALTIYDKLIDFNMLNKTSSTPFTYNAEETIYYSRIINLYSELTSARSVLTYGIDPELIQLYDPSDLRLQIYFSKNTDGNFNIKRINTLSTFPFAGLATDELYLIRAECLARGGELVQAMYYYNKLLSTRWDPNATGSYVPYADKSVTTVEEALDMILTERRRALVFRGVRWTDLKRLNLEDRKIRLSRQIGGEVYYLEPNSSRYVMPIPEEEILKSGIQQNIRK